MLLQLWLALWGLIINSSEVEYVPKSHLCNNVFKCLANYQIWLKYKYWQYASKIFWIIEGMTIKSWLLTNCQYPLINNRI